VRANGFNAAESATPHPVCFNAKLKPGSAYAQSVRRLNILATQQKIERQNVWLLASLQAAVDKIRTVLKTCASGKGQVSG
jgi:hypothetical protein